MAEHLPLILVLPVLLVLSGIASGSETALFRLSHRERADLLRTAPAVGAAVETLLSDPRRLLLFVLLLNMVVNVSYFVVSSVLTTRMDTRLAAAGVGAGSVLAIVLFGEILAKVAAGAGRRAFCLVLGQPLAALAVLLGPIVAALDTLVLSPLIRLIRPHQADPGRVHPSELARLVEMGGQAGVLTEGERRLLGEVIELGEVRVREAMRPRDRVLWLPASASAQEIIALASTHRRTVIVLAERSLDDGLVGFLHVKRYLAARHALRRDPDPREFADPALVIPEQARLDRALETMRERQKTHAICVDERGMVVGMIDAVDIVDELLAGMGDERTAERHTIRLVGLGRWQVSARLAARDWAQYFRVPEAEFSASLTRTSTVGGVLMDRLGRLPRPGDEARFGPVLVRAESVVGRRLVTVVVELTDEPAAPAGSGEGR